MPEPKENNTQNPPATNPNSTINNDGGTPSTPPATNPQASGDDKLDKFGYKTSEQPDQKPEEKKPDDPTSTGYQESGKEDPKPDDKKPEEKKPEEKESDPITGYEKEPDKKSEEKKPEEKESEDKPGEEFKIKDPGDLLPDEVSSIENFAKDQKLTKEQAEAMVQSKKDEVAKYKVSEEKHNAGLKTARAERNATWVFFS